LRSGQTEWTVPHLVHVCISDTFARISSGCAAIAQHLPRTARKAARSSELLRLRPCDPPATCDSGSTTIMMAPG
jgi:hypothetical protein